MAASSHRESGRRPLNCVADSAVIEDGVRAYFSHSFGFALRYVRFPFLNSLVRVRLMILGGIPMKDIQALQAISRPSRTAPSSGMQVGKDVFRKGRVCMGG